MGRNFFLLNAEPNWEIIQRVCNGDIIDLCRSWLFGDVMYQLNRDGSVFARSNKERATRVRVSNYIKIEAGQNFPPVLKIVTSTAGVYNTVK